MFGISRIQLFGCGLVAAAIVAVGLGVSGSGGGDGAAGADGASYESGAVGAGAVEISDDRSGLVVHVAGAVRNPGVYELKAGSRVIDALRAAGGATRDGDASAVNLAAPLADGQQVVVPWRAGRGGSAEPPGGRGGPVNIATASQAELEELDGIGPATAAKIIAYRQEKGGITSIEQLAEIHGIGPATIELLKNQLSP